MIKQNKQDKYLILNSSNAENYKWSIPDLNLSRDSEIALIGVQSAFINSNLNFIYCPSILNNNYESSLNTPPVIYCGIGYDILNITKNNYYGVHGANLNEIELKLFSSPPLNNFSYPELDGLKPNFWLKFDTGAITTNSGTDNITLTNLNNATNAGVSVRGNNSLALNGTNQYLTGAGLNLTNNGSFSISIWFYAKVLSGTAYNIICQFYRSGGSFWVNFPNSYKYELGMPGFNILTTSTFAGDVNNWVHLVFTYNITNKQFLFYRNGVLLPTTTNIVTAGMVGYINTNFSIGATNTSANFFNGNIDDLRTYQFVLSQEQINVIYGSQKNYPIIKNESYKLPHPTDNELNIDLTPNIWLKFDTGGLLTNSGTDTTLMTNAGTTSNADVYIRGNNSASFNGTSQYLTNNNSYPFLGISGNSWSVSAWVYSKSSTTNGTIINFGNSGTAFQTLMGGFTSTKYYISDVNSTALSVNFAGDVNNWVHIVFIFNSQTLERSIYRNGVKLTLTNPTAGGQSTVSTRFSTAAANSIGNFYNGNIDDLRIYTGKILTQDEITRIYNGDKIDYSILTIEPVIGQDLSPLIWYKFDDSTNIGLDTMGKANFGANYANALMTYDNTTTVRGGGSIKGIAGQSLLANYNFIDVIDEFTICFWMRISTLNTNWDNIIYSINLQSKFLISRNGATNNFYVTFFGSGSLGAQTHFVGGYIADNIWKHYTITTQKTTTGAVKTTSYLNGVLNNTYTAGTWDKSGILTLGLSSGTAILGFIGNLDDMRIYNRTLTQTQINEIYAGNPFYNLPTNFNKYSTINDHLNLNLNIKDINRNEI